jgi:hypothetical protein
MNTKTLGLTALLIGLGGAVAAASSDGVFTYQGRVQAAGADFSGIGLFKFALVSVTNIAVAAKAEAGAPSGGFITVITVVDGGNGYATAPEVTLTGGGGSGAAATASIDGGVVAGITVNNPGSGYSTAPTVTIAPPPPNLVYTTFWSNDGTSSGGSEPTTAVSVPVSAGLFTVRLGDTSLANMRELTPALFEQADLHLRLWFNDGVNGFAVLSPVQPLTAAPYALTAGSANKLSGVVPPSGLSGTYSSTVAFNNPANSFAGIGTGLTGLNASQLTGGTVPDARLSDNIARMNQVWGLEGNAGTTGAQFLGTTDYQPLELRVRSQRALLLINNGDGMDTNTLPDGAPNLVGGSEGNFVDYGLSGATICGGGATNLDGVRLVNTIGSDFASIVGGYKNTVGYESTAAVIGGGRLNTIASSSPDGVIAGGNANQIRADAPYNTIGGGELNQIAASCTYSTVAGGRTNQIGNTTEYSVISGGGKNKIGTNSWGATIGGGYENEIGASSISSAISAGGNNILAQHVYYANIAGGRYNSIDTRSDYGTLSGGYYNEIGARSPDSTVSGGAFNTIGTNADFSVIGGGHRNSITNNASYATIPGGEYNVATNYAFAAGRRAKARHQGGFVWGDSNNSEIASTNANSVTMRASGGYRLFSNSGATAGVYLAPGAGSWTSMSDRKSKENLAPVDPGEVLAKVAALPMATWNYKSQDASVRHIGPMAQDFMAAFNVGESETGISTIDAEGVALAAIQGLNQKLEAEAAALRSENALLKQRLARIEHFLESSVQKP